jgi:hypothetical protein
MQTGTKLNVADVQRDARFSPAIDARTGIRTCNGLTVPIRNHTGKIVGVLHVLNKKQGYSIRKTKGC